jgi:cell division septation protein DedD
MSPQVRARGVERARDMRTAPPPVQIAARPSQNPPRSQAPARTQAPPRTATATPRPRPPARTATRAASSVATAGGRWKVQIGAFSNEANARRAWGAVAGRLPGLRPSYVRAGAVIRVQAGPLGDRAAAQRACAAAGNGCYPVAP